MSVLGFGRREALVTCFGLLVASVSADARVLRNDSLEPGERIGFYPNMNGGDGVAVVLPVPEDVVDFTICAIQTWFGPDDFTVVEARISTALQDASPDVLLWMGDLDAFQLFGSEVALSETFSIASEEDIDASTGHVRRHRDRTESPGLGDNVGFTKMQFRVEYLVSDAAFVEIARKRLGLFNRNRADKNRLTSLGSLDDVLNDCVVFSVFGLVNEIALVEANHWTMSGNRNDMKVVCGEEL